MLVVILFFGTILDKMNMFSISHVNRTRSFATEFMKIFIGKRYQNYRLRFLLPPGTLSYIETV